jgi:ribosomal protein S1
MNDKQTGNRGRNGGKRIDANAAVALNSIVTATVREVHRDRGFVIVRFGERESCSALMAAFECEVGDAEQKKQAFDKLAVGTVVTGKIVRKGDDVPTSLRLSVRQYKQDTVDRERAEARKREQTERTEQLTKLRAANRLHGVVRGVIYRKETYGVFVEFPECPRWHALVHVTDMCGRQWQRNEFLASLQLGEELEGVLTVKEEGDKTLLSLSLAKVEESKREAQEREAKRQRAEATLASLVPGKEFSGAMFFDLGAEGVDGTDAGIILEYNDAHVWVPEKELGDDAKRRQAITRMVVRYVGLDAEHDDMPYVELVR